MSCGWHGKLKELLEISKDEFCNILTNYVEGLDFPVSEGQQESWKDCYEFIVQNLDLNKFGDTYLAFEYMLPLEGGRRIDVILFFSGRIVILEFKRKGYHDISDIEQTIGYREDVKNFHKETYKNNLQVEAYLVLTKSEKVDLKEREIFILTRNNFNNELGIYDLNPMNEDEVLNWINSEYEPIPSVIEATLDLFQNGHLPYIKNISEGEIEATVKKVKAIIYNNEVKFKDKKIVFVSGVPGSGKTLVALKTLYDYNYFKYNKFNNKMASIYVSGNGPLVSVLQDQLESVEFNGSKGKAFIKRVYNIKKDYLNNNNIPNFNVILFDEAQRAWDKEMMGRYNVSEPEALLSIGDKVFSRNKNATLVCFMGDGQSIHIGEEKGLPLWVDALKLRKDWQVIIPPNYKDSFKDISSTVSDQLYLDTSIRSNFIDTSSWIEAVLSGDFEKARKDLLVMQNKGLVLRVSRNYEACKNFLYSMEKAKRGITYGLLVSSKVHDMDMKKFLNNNNFTSYMSDNEAGKWFLNESKALNKAASEFVCQGLELDYPLVCFGGDYYFDGAKWCIEESIFKKYQRKDFNNPRQKREYDDFKTIVLNIYRVLLSRARKGMVLYIPNIDRLNKTYGFMKRIGIDEI